MNKKNRNMNNRPNFSREIIQLQNIDEVVESICEKLRDDVFKRFRRQGAVIGVSGVV